MIKKVRRQQNDYTATKMAVFGCSSREWDQNSHIDALCPGPLCGQAVFELTPESLKAATDAPSSASVLVSLAIAPS